MEFHDVIKNRRSCREFKKDPIPEDALKRIGEAVECAPSACNLQPWSFRIVLNSELKQKICGVYSRDWLKDAPAIIVALGNMKECWMRPEGNPIADIDIGIAMEHAVLAATAEGLATCWICAYEMEKMNHALNIIPPWKVLAISPLGYAAKAPKPIERKPLNSIFQVLN